MRRRALLALVLLGCVACWDHGPPAPVTTTATLVSPNGAEGAAVLLLAGAGVGLATGVDGTEVYQGPTDLGTTRLVLVNRLGGTLSFELELADEGSVPAVVVEQVAGPDDELREDLSGYTLEIGP